MDFCKVGKSPPAQSISEWRMTSGDGGMSSFNPKAWARQQFYQGEGDCWPQNLGFKHGLLIF